MRSLVRREGDIFVLVKSCCKKVTKRVVFFVESENCSIGDTYEYKKLSDVAFTLLKRMHSGPLTSIELPSHFLLSFTKQKQLISIQTRY